MRAPAGTGDEAPDLVAAIGAQIRARLKRARPAVAEVAVRSVKRLFPSLAGKGRMDGPWMPSRHSRRRCGKGGSPPTGRAIWL
jgi:hypothetical protein